MASPVTIIELTFSAAAVRHTRSASKRAVRMMRSPTKLRPRTDHCVAPCMSGAMGKWVITKPWPRSTNSSGRSRRVLVVGSTPPPRAKTTSLCCQTTPLGMPVVPPV